MSDLPLAFALASASTTAGKVVMAKTDSPTVRRWEVAARLRALRLEAGLSIDQVAERLLCSPSKISRIETAARAASQRDVRDLCNIYDVRDDGVRADLMQLARQAKEHGWWQNYDEVASRSSTYIGLEEAASSIQWYETVRIPGLLQVSEYVRAIMRGLVPSLDNEALDQFVASRRERQQLLDSPQRPQVWFIIDEAAVRRQVGGPKVMLDQILHILARAQLPNITIQLIPFAAGAHAGMDGTFTILKFPQDTLGDVVYVEGRSGQLFLSRVADVLLYRETFDHLRASAVSPDESLALLERIADQTGR